MDTLLRRRMMMTMLGGTPPTPPTPILPQGYTQLLYIENPLGSSAYFSTGVAQNAPTDFTIDFMSYDEKNKTSGQYGCILGSRNSSNSRDFQITTYTNTTGWNGTLRLGASANNFNANLPAKNTRFTAELSGTSYSCNGSTSTVSRGTLSTYAISVFALNQNGTIVQNGHGRLYSLKLYANSVLTRDYIPCIDPNNIVGVYDLINDTFTSSANSTSFVAGTII